MTQKRTLKAHPKLLMDVIKRQAGSLHKAALEGVMNSIEANASLVEIDFLEGSGKTKSILYIKDNGKGIVTSKEIEDFFETFGTPHDESENKKWAQFRMGRGQLFAFGKNTWRTGSYKMIVDIKNMGLEYDLQEDLDFIDGCTIDIELYDEPIGNYYSSLKSFKENIKSQIEFMDIPVLFNGDKLNTPVSECNWEYEDKNAYYNWDIGTGLTIYNLGAYVKRISSSHAGTTGIIVSKKQLKVNFARNDIQSDCCVWNEINKIIKKNRKKKTRKKNRRLEPYERIALLKDVRDGEQDWSDIKQLKIVQMANDKFCSLADVVNCTQPWSFAQLGDRMADRLMERKQAVVFAEDVYKILGYNGCFGGFWAWLLSETRSRYALKKIQSLGKLYRPMKTTGYEKGLSDHLSDEYHLFHTKDLTIVERRIAKILNKYSEYFDNRTMIIGRSDIAEAWTDGKTYIAIDRDFLKRCYLPHGSHTLVSVLIHELAHDCQTYGTHVHGETFYKRFHDICMSNNYGAYGGPLSLIASFYYEFKRAKINEKYEKEQNKKEKTKIKRDKKLGIAAKTK